MSNLKDRILASRSKTPAHVLPMWQALGDRFVSKFDIDEDTQCWVWSASSRRGYGRFCAKRGVGRRRNRMVAAHKHAYEVLVGPVPEGLQLDHLCRNRSCVNPSHLEPVTASENRKRAASLKTHCPHGHPYSGGNVYVNSRGHRTCKTCRRDRMRETRSQQ